MIVNRKETRAEKCRSPPHGQNWKFVIFEMNRIFLFRRGTSRFVCVVKTTKCSSFSTTTSHLFALRVAILKILYSISLFYGIFERKEKREKDQQQQEIKLWNFFRLQNTKRIWHIKDVKQFHCDSFYFLSVDFKTF